MNHDGVKLIIKTHTQCLLTEQLIAVYLIISKNNLFSHINIGSLSMRLSHAEVSVICINTLSYNAGNALNPNRLLMFF